MRPFSELIGAGTSTGGGPCIYCQVDEEENSEGEIETREVIIIPSDPTTRKSLLSLHSRSYAAWLARILQPLT